MNIEDMKEALTHIRKAQEIFARGPLEYYLEKLVQHSEALTTKFAPIKAGEHAIIVREIPCTGGWKGSEKTLAVGQVGKVERVDYDEKGFIYEFVPLKQWYEYQGEWREKSSLHSYCLREKYLVPATEDDIRPYLPKADTSCTVARIDDEL